MPKPIASPSSRKKDAQAPATIRVLLSDQHALVRAGIRALLDELKEIEVVAEAAGPRQTLELIKLSKPEIVLLDIAAAGFGMLGILKNIVQSFPDVRVIVLAAQENEELAVQALRSGAAGFISKTAASAELELAIRAVTRGEVYLASDISRHALLNYLKTANSREPLTKLTARQSEVLQLIAEGHATKEIARRLNISVKTVETHRSQIMTRLDMHDVPSLVRHALRIGLIDVE